MEIFKEQLLAAHIQQGEISKNDVDFAVATVLEAHRIAGSEDAEEELLPADELKTLAVEELRQREVKRSQEARVAEARNEIEEAEALLRETEASFQKMKQDIDLRFTNIESGLKEKDFLAEVRAQQADIASKQSAVLFKESRRVAASRLSEDLRTKRKAIYSQLVDLANEALIFWSDHTGRYSNDIRRAIGGFPLLHTQWLLDLQGEKDTTGGVRDQLVERLKVFEESAGQLLERMEVYRMTTQVRMESVAGELREVFDPKTDS